MDTATAQGLKRPPERIPWRHRLDWPAARQQIARLVEQHRIDLLHTHDNLSNTIVGIGRSRWPCACVASAYGWWEAREQWKLRAYYQVERRLALPNFDGVCTVSLDMRRKIIDAGTPTDKVKVIRTGIATGQRAPTGQRAAVRGCFGIPENAVVGGTVSRLAPEKGHGVLLKAFHSIRKVAPTFTS